MKRVAMLEDWQAAEMLIVLWREQHYQLVWTEVIPHGGKYLDIKIRALEGHGTERLKMRLWHFDFEAGLKRLPKVQRDAVLNYIERRWHEVLIVENMVTGEHEVIAEPDLDRAMQRMHEWLGSSEATSANVPEGWYKLKTWHYVRPDGTTLCREYQILSADLPEKKPLGGVICQVCKKRVP